MTPALVVPSSPPRPPAAAWQRLHRLFGFQKGCNFVLWCLFALGSLSFTLSRISYLDYFGVFCRKNYLSRGNHAAPGECYYFLNGGKEQIGMMLHLYSIIPGCLLLFIQFVPVLRQRLVLFHRINGYIVLLLMAVAVVGGFMSASGSFGGDSTFQTAVGVHGTLVVTGLFMAMANIKRLQVEQHRAWMLRAWAWVRHKSDSRTRSCPHLDPRAAANASNDADAYAKQAFTAITMRVFQLFAAGVISGRGYVAARPCAQVASDGVVPASVIEARWPECAAYFSGESPGQMVVVDADYYGLPAEINVALSVASGVCAFLAILLHTAAVELYVSCHPPHVPLVGLKGWRASRQADFWSSVAPPHAGRVRASSACLVSQAACRWDAASRACGSGRRPLRGRCEVAPSC